MHQAILDAVGMIGVFQGGRDTFSIGEYWAESWLMWVFAAVVVIVVPVVRLGLSWYVNARIMKDVKKTKTKADDKLVEGVHKALSALFIFVAVWLAALIIPIPETEVLTIGKTTYSLREVFQLIALTLIIFYLARVLMWILDIVIYFARIRAEKTKTKIDEVLLPLLRDAGRVLLWIFTILLIIQFWGFNVTTIIAGLGIGGLAIAFAAQDAVANVFGSITVLVDKPFEVGDWVIIGDVEGVVEEVGIRSTKIRTFSKTLITLPNSKITTSAIQNFSRMPIRRVKMDIGLAYWTTPEQMHEFVESSRELLRTHPGVDQNYWLVYFDKFTDSSLSIFFYFFSKSTVWAEYLAVRQDVNLRLMKLAERIGVDFAYPTSVDFNMPLVTAKPHPGLSLEYRRDGGDSPEFHSGTEGPKGESSGE